MRVRAGAREMMEPGRRRRRVVRSDPERVARALVLTGYGTRAPTVRLAVAGAAVGGARPERRARLAVVAVDIEACMAAFEARVAALNSQIEAAGTAEQRP